MDVVGRYRVEGRLKAGGAVDVLLARAEGPHGFERRVVLKVVAPEHRGDPEAERALVREARAYARLTHPGIVRLYDFFEDAGRLVVVLDVDDPPSTRSWGACAPRASGRQLGAARRRARSRPSRPPTPRRSTRSRRHITTAT